MSQTPYPIAHDAKQALRLWQEGDEAKAVRQSEAEEISQSEIYLCQEPVSGPYAHQDEAENALKSLMTPKVANEGILKCVARFQQDPAKPAKPPLNNSPQPNQRWPKGPKLVTHFMIEIIYWKIGPKSAPSWEILRQRQRLEAMMKEPMVAKKSKKPWILGYLNSYRLMIRL